MKLAGPKRPAFHLYHTLWSTLDLLFPPTCGGCQTLGVRWCADCQSKVTRMMGPICSQCGDFLPSPNSATPQENSSDICPACKKQPPGYIALRSYGIFQGTLREALHRLKYQHDIGLGEALSKHLIELYNDLRWNIQIIAPVPLSAKRMQERGYNQSGLLGRPLAYAIDQPYLPGVLLRNRDTRTQVGLSAKDRRQNVQGAFTANPKLVKGKTVLVVDDVTTTGSTISACAQALDLAGASAVYGLTLARAVLQADVDDLPNPLHFKRR